MRPSRVRVRAFLKAYQAHLGQSVLESAGTRTWTRADGKQAIEQRDIGSAGIIPERTTESAPAEASR